MIILSMDDRGNIIYEAHARPVPSVIQIRDPDKVSSKSPGPGLGFPSTEMMAAGQYDTQLHLTQLRVKMQLGHLPRQVKWRLLQKLTVWKYLIEATES